MKTVSCKLPIIPAMLIAFTIGLVISALPDSGRGVIQKKKYICNILSPKETAKIHKKNHPDVKIVWNREKGLWDKQGLQKVELVHELTIGGNENEANKIFYCVENVVADHLGNIYINEMFQGKIRKFSADGDFLRTNGHRGQGPGEYSSSFLKVNLDRDENFVIYDFGTNRISHFNSEGQFIKSVNLSKAATNPGRGLLSIDSDIYYISHYNENSQTVIHQYDCYGKLLYSFGLPAQFKKTAVPADRILKLNMSGGPLCQTPYGLLYSQRNPYEIRHYNSEGQLVWVAYRENSFIPPHKMEIISKDGVSTRFSSTATLIHCWEDKIVNCVYVADKVSKELGCVVDIFNMDGELLSSKTIKNKTVFKYMDPLGRLYGYQIDPITHEEVIVRFRLEKVH